MVNQRLNILVFSFFPAVVPATSGGEKRLYEFYKALSQYHNIRMISSSWPDVSTSAILHGSNFREFRVQKPSQIYDIYNKLLRCASLGADVSGPAVYLAGLQPNEMHQIYFDNYRNTDIIIHDSPFTISYDVMAGADLIPRIYNSYNSETQLYAQMHPEEKSKLIRDTVREAELKILSSVDIVGYCSEEDKNAFSKLVPHVEDYIFVPNGGVNRGRVNKTKQTGDLQAIFIGSAHQPNQEAARFIVNEMAPRCPDVVFHITGNCLSDGNFPSNIRRYGFVTEEVKDQLLSSCDVALNPMTTGGGSNLKIMEYLSYGIPIVSTRFGVRGTGLIPGLEYIDIELKDFPKSLDGILDNLDALNKIGEAGRHKFQRTLTWSSIARKFANKLGVLSEKRRKRDLSPVLGINDYDFTQVQSGGATRIRGLYEQMRHERTVFYVVLTDSIEWSISFEIEGIILFKVPKTQQHRIEQQRIDSQYHLSAADIVNLYMMPDNTFLVSLIEMLSSHTCCTIIDHIYSFGVIDSDGFWVYSSQNHETSLKAEILSDHPCKDFLLEKVRVAEDAAMQLATLTVCVSETDASKFVAGRTNSVPTVVIPNGVLPPDAEDEEAASRIVLDIKDQSCVFIGSVHPPNIDACDFIINTVAPALPDIEFHIAGNVSNLFIGRSPPNVRLWGKITDPQKIALLKAVKLAINPVDTGGGSNVKISDYFSFGLPVVSTSFGSRGFSSEVVDALIVAERDKFAKAISDFFGEPHMVDGKEYRIELFNKYLNAASLGRSLADLISSLSDVRKRILFVTYRLTYPPRGGAEAHLLKLIEFLSRTGRYDIDLVAPNVDFIGETGRFGGIYSMESLSSGPFGLPNVRWARFPVDASDPKGTDEKLRRIWEAQATFEKSLLQQSLPSAEPLLLWGWGAVEGNSDEPIRWVFASAAIFAPLGGHLELTGVAYDSAVISSGSDSSTFLDSRRLEGKFSIELDVAPGLFSLEISSTLKRNADPRPLGICVYSISIDGKTVPQADLGRIRNEDPDLVIENLSNAAFETRRGCSLSDVRGPFSGELEAWIEQNMDNYDLLITHNNIFRPVNHSLEIANAKKVPSVLIPHAHLDDDYYHFPDMIHSIRHASAVLAAPSSAVRYFGNFNNNVHYHNPGIDLGEAPTSRDIAAFYSVHVDKSPFVLVLGRKAGAKNYRWVIESALQQNLRVVMVGPDDDGMAINEPNVTYLGSQPRNVVRGALASCLFLVNMSSSESFGMVIIEAWLAKRAVIANRECAAFQDIIKDGENGLLVSRSELPTAMNKLSASHELRRNLGEAGSRVVSRYDWSSIGREFEQICNDVMINTY